MLPESQADYYRELQRQAWEVMDEPEIEQVKGQAGRESNCQDTQWPEDGDNG